MTNNINELTMNYINAWRFFGCGCPYAFKLNTHEDADDDYDEVKADGGPVLGFDVFDDAAQKHKKTLPRRRLCR